ncbi:MAG: CoA transferase [Burkholderiaceae bacterium]|nr:CoA transferase [Burkholderiaceae bacterium]
MSAISTALSGVKVVEFGAYAAGPHIGKMLASFGAKVIHVESRSRPDGFRAEYPPFKDGRPGLDRGGCFAMFNDSKRAVTLDLKNDAGLEMARRLIAWSDIVVENMRPEVMTRLGLGYEAARKLNPGVVMISSCNMGQSGPRAHTPGFGSQLSALAGFCGLTGSPDGPPQLLYGPYIDFIASSLGASAVLAALDRQRRCGRGAWIDLSQYESGLVFIASALHEYHSTQATAQRANNRDPRAAPHDAFPCRGGRWLALSCWSDREFEQFSEILGRPGLAKDPRFASLEARMSHEAELSEIVAQWSADQEAPEAAALLQSAGLRAYAVNTMADLFADPQLLHRRVWRRRRHGVMGDLACYFSAFDLSDTPGDVTGAAPLLGADNAYVFCELLGLSAEQYDHYQRLGAFE